MGSPLEYDSVSRRLAKKLSRLMITKEEYVLMKAILLLNPGKFENKDGEMQVIICIRYEINNIDRPASMMN